MIEFYDRSNLNKPYIDFFIKLPDKSNKHVGVSIFRSEFTYSDDTEEYKAKNKRDGFQVSSRKRSSIEILSITESRLVDGKMTESVLVSQSAECVAEYQRKSDELKEKKKN